MVKKFLGNLGVFTVYFPFRWMCKGMSFEHAINFSEKIAKLHSKLPVPPQPQIINGIRNVMGDQWSARHISEVMESSLKTRYLHLVELFLAGRVSAENISIRVSSVHGIGNLDSAIKLNKGVVLLGFHFGSYGVPLAVLSFRGYTLYQHAVLSHLYSGKSFSLLDREILKIKMKCHSSVPVKMIYHKDGNYAGKLVRCLKQNGILVIMGDGSRGGRFTTVKFLGKKIAISTGPATLAGITGAAIVPVFTVRESDKRHRVIIHDPIFVEHNDPESIEGAVSEYTGLLEDYVLEYPGHWYTWDRLSMTKDNEGEDLIQPVVRNIPVQNI